MAPTRHSSQPLDMAATANLYSMVVMARVPDRIYDAFMEEIMALPDKKRAAWKRTLIDNTGTKTRCVYRDGKIYNYSVKAHMWAEVRSMSDAREEVQSGAVEWTPLSPAGVAMMESDEAALRALNQETDANQTGNHYRNKHIRIPKSSDSRVRQ